jgi:O-antigen ligase
VVPRGQQSSYSLSRDESVRQVGKGPELLRRLLLGWITALMVARPLILGEDPGLLANGLSDASNLVLSLLWLAAGAGWAAWRAWSRQGTWCGSLVEPGLLGVAGLSFVSAQWAAAYHHPAYLIAWEWLVLVVVFCLIRQLAQTAADNRRLLAALLASGVSLSVYGIYQYHTELPQLRQHVLEHLDTITQEAVTRGVGDDLRYADLVKRVQESNIYATFAHPNSFAGFLALLFPAVLGAAWTGRRATGWSPSTLLLIGCTLFMVIALWLTHSRGAILGVVLVGALIAWGVGRKAWGVEHAGNAPRAKRHAPRFSIALLFLLGIAVLGFVFYGREGLDLARRSADKRWDYWTATWRMITDGKYPYHLWLGVGPGNFSRYYPRYMAQTASEQIKDPHNFVLEAWASTGVFALAALLLALGVFFWKTRFVWSRPTVVSGGVVGSERPEAAPVTTHHSPLSTHNSAMDSGFATRWEFYFAGMAGLILGFVSSTSLQSTDEMIVNGAVAGVRSMIWFAAFALFEIVPWTAPMRCLVLTAGAAALLLNWCVSGGLSFPSVAQPFWIVIALALNAGTEDRGAGSGAAPRILSPSRSRPGVVLPLPVLASLCLIYLLFVFVPVTRSVGYMMAAGFNANRYHAMEAELGKKLKEGAEAPGRQSMIYANLRFLDRELLPLIQKANKEDPGDSYPLQELARWYGERYKLSVDIKSRHLAAQLADQVTKLDPENKAGYLIQYWLNDQFASMAQSDKDAFYDFAAQAMLQAVKRDPTDARLRYQYADALFKARRPVDGRAAAQEAIRLDALSVEATRKLSEPQREQARKWLMPES